MVFGWIWFLAIFQTWLIEKGIEILFWLHKITPANFGKWRKWVKNGGYKIEPEEWGCTTPSGGEEVPRWRLRFRSRSRSSWEEQRENKFIIAITRGNWGVTISWLGRTPLFWSPDESGCLHRASENIAFPSRGLGTRGGRVFSSCFSLFPLFD